MRRKCWHLSCEQRFKIYGLRVSLDKSFRELETILGIPKSTIHYNLPAILKEVETLDSDEFDPTKLLVYFVIAGVFEGKMSARSTMAMIFLLFKVEISHPTLLKILGAAAKIANDFNQELKFDGLLQAVFDEIFKGKKPILGMADPVSGIIFLKAGADRTAEEWENYLKSLKKMGLELESTTTDGGTSLLSGLQSVFPKAIKIRDLFHVLQKMSKAKRKMEGVCYGLILQKDLSSPKERAVKTEKCDQAIQIFDAFEESLIAFNASYHSFSDDDQAQFISSTELATHLQLCHDLLQAFGKNIGKFEAINSAKTYIKNGFKAIVAYKELIESKVLKIFGKTYSEYADVFLKTYVPLIECMVKYKQSYENRKAKDYWGSKAQKMIEQLKALPVDEDVIDGAIGQAWKIMHSSAKSSSYIECVNAVIRSHLDTFKSIPEWFCQIFTFYWNNRELKRGKRAGSSSMKLFQPNDASSKNWIDRIMEKFPFDKFRSGISWEQLRLVS